MVFTERSRDQKIPNVWLSSHNFGEVSVIQKFHYFQNEREFCMGGHVE